MTAAPLFEQRKSLDQICKVPDKIISVYSLEQHVWAGNNSTEARVTRQAELQTIEEFQINPVRPFLNDILRGMAAPYRPDRRGEPIGQAYWIQAEFGSGKSHLLCFLAALAVGGEAAWRLVDDKERKAGRGRRESLYQFWEEGLSQKYSGDSKGIFVLVKTLVGTGGSVVGLDSGGSRLIDYILEAATEQIQLQLGRNLSLYPTELLADRFLKEDVDRYRKDLQKFLRDPRYLEDGASPIEVNDFIAALQSGHAKRDYGNTLWRFYTEYLDVRPNIAAEPEAILKHLVELLLAEGYAGLLLVLDEVSLFMKNRSDEQRADDEQTLVVLANRLAKVHGLPIWTVCSAQQAIESKMGVRNIIADDRLKLVMLLAEANDYFDIVLARVRAIIDPQAIGPYYQHYKRGFTLASTITEQEFAHFFPFHRPALEVVRAITYELTTARSAIHFMHQTLKYQVKRQGHDTIRLWELFDEAVGYEEDPSGVYAGLTAIKSKREGEYRAYENSREQIKSLAKGSLKVYRERAVNVMQTLFLYHIAKLRTQGLSAEDIANSVLEERNPDSTVEENQQHYESLAEALAKELRQVGRTLDEGSPRFRFDPVVTGIDPRQEFDKALDEAASNEVLRREAWEALLALDGWIVKSNLMQVDLSAGVKSPFRDLLKPGGAGGTVLEIAWQGRSVSGLAQLNTLTEQSSLPRIESDETDRDFAVVVSSRAVTEDIVKDLLKKGRDPRILIWSPARAEQAEDERLQSFAAYRQLVSKHAGKESEDSITVMSWVRESLRTEMAGIIQVIAGRYGRGRIDSLAISQMDFTFAGELTTILSPLVGRVLDASYESRDIVLPKQFTFRKEEAVKVINGIVRIKSIPANAKPNQDISAVQNFGLELKLLKAANPRQLDTSDNPYVRDIWHFIDEKLTEGDGMPVATLYKNFMGIGTPKSYGLSRRLVQLYLLCLVRQGTVRVRLSAKAGLTVPMLDYATIGDVEFSARVLDALAEVQKMAKPALWDTLRPFAEKFLDETIADGLDDAAIADHRFRLRTLFVERKETSTRRAARAAELFATLERPNPYGDDLDSLAALYAHDLGEDDISSILYAMKSALGYTAFDDERADQQQVDDLAGRLRRASCLASFLDHETELRAAHAYTAAAIPDAPELHESRRLQTLLRQRLAALQPYIDSDVRLRTELLGSTPPDPAERDTFAVLVREYTSAYAALHDQLGAAAEDTAASLRQLLEGDDMRVLQLVEGISALQPPVSAAIAAQIGEMESRLFSCPAPARSSVEQQLKSDPVHTCRMTFETAATLREAARSVAKEAPTLLRAALCQKLDVLVSPAIQERLRSGGAENPVVAAILRAGDAHGLRDYLIHALAERLPVAETVDRYLKRIEVRTVRLADFKPAVSTLERAGVADLALEFQQFLEEQFARTPGDGQTLLMLRVE